MTSYGTKQRKGVLSEMTPFTYTCITYDELRKLGVRGKNSQRLYPSHDVTNFTIDLAPCMTEKELETISKER